MKKGWEKRFDEWWFVPKEHTTIMNWEGLIADTRAPWWMPDPYGHSAEDNELYLKKELATLIKAFIKDEIKNDRR